MKKKLLSVLIAIAMVSSLSVTAFAATVTEDGGESSADVKGTYVAGKTTPTVYSVDVAWGSMEFTYTDEYIGDWNPATHNYVNPIPAAWSCDTDANKVTVTNHSNTAITATFDYTQKSEYTSVTGAFSNTPLDIPSAVNTEVSAAPNASSSLSLNGDLSKEASNITVGTVTVSIK